MQVVFTSRYGPYFEGANPVLADAEAARLIEMGVCKPAGELDPKPPQPEPAPPEPEPTPEPEPEPEPDKPTRRGRK